jgi:hypothetical protein
MKGTPDNTVTMYGMNAACCGRNCPGTIGCDSEDMGLSPKPARRRQSW